MGEFEWDKAKSARCFRERGFDFEFVSAVFEDPNRLDRVDARRDYGETRHQVIGIIEGDVYFVAFTTRGVRIRIISARKADDQEKDAYRSGDPWR